MCTICGAECNGCQFSANCRGCEATCGKPFGGTCVAAEYIKSNGKEKYAEFKQNLLAEVNALLKANNIPPAGALYELPGSFVNLPYPLPSGETVKFLDNTKMYLGTQIENTNSNVCYGVVVDMDFILVCSYGINGSNPKLMIYKSR